MNLNEALVSQYAQCLRTAIGADRDLRAHAWAAFERMGLPGRSTETWKYSSLKGVSAGPWAPAAASDEIPARARDLIQRNKADFDIALIINGKFQTRESRLTLESGYEFLRYAPDPKVPFEFEDGLMAAAIATHTHGFELRVAPGMKFQRPLLLVHVQNGEGSWAATLNRITLGAGSEFQLAEVFLGSARGYLRTDITQCEQGDDCRLNWVRTQEESAGASYYSHLQTRLQTGAALSFAQVNGGAAWARASLKVEILGERAEAAVNGLSFGRDKQHVDQRVEICHMAGHSASSQLFKGILKDSARGVLNGKIFIARNAQKVSSSQLNHNLLLGPHAEADTKPELEIYADDVKANHGASIGRMDDDKLFYLMSRAIPRAQAQQMLAHAFVGDVLMKVQHPLLRELLTDRVTGLLPDYSSQMETE